MAVTEHQSNGIACTSCYADCRCYSSSGVSEIGCVWCYQGRSHPRWSHSSEDTKRSPHSRPPHWSHYQHLFTWCIYTLKLVSLPSEVTRPETHGGVVQRVKVREYRTCCHGVLPGACRASDEAATSNGNFSKLPPVQIGIQTIFFCSERARRHLFA
jgi:hypothetical protein